jgi:hypothetical protein
MRTHPKAAILLAAAGTALAAVLLAAPTAHADQYTQDDPAGDMSRDGRRGAVPAPGHSNLDIRHVIVRHTDHFVSIRAVVDTLTRPRGDESFHLSGFVKPNRQARPWESTAWSYEVEFDRTKPRIGDRMFILDSTHQEMFGCSGYSDHGLKARANYDRDRVTMIIPRRCLNTQDDNPDVRPRWVQVSVQASHSPRTRTRYFDRVNAPHPSSGDIYLAGSYFTPRLYPG